MAETEKMCAQIEKELLAVVYSIERWDIHTYGRHVKVETHHKLWLQRRRACSACLYASKITILNLFIGREAK